MRAKLFLISLTIGVSVLIPRWGRVAVTVIVTKRVVAFELAFELEWPPRLEHKTLYLPLWGREIKLKYFSKTLLNKAISTSQKVCKSQYSDAQKKENKNVQKWYPSPRVWIGTYSNFSKYVKKKEMKPEKSVKGHPRFECVRVWFFSQKYGVFRVCITAYTFLQEIDLL